MARDIQVWPLVEPATLGRARPRPQRWVPPRAASGKGRRRTRERLHPASPPPLRLDALAAQLPAAAWHRYRILEGSRGPLVADFAALRAVAVRDGLPGPEVWVLLRRPVHRRPEAAELQVLPLQRARRHRRSPPWSACKRHALADRVLLRGGRRASSGWTTTSCASGAAGTTT